MQKFFFDGRGRLYGVVGPEFSLDSEIVARVAEVQ
jgi:hypothetical protein